MFKMSPSVQMNILASLWYSWRRRGHVINTYTQQPMAQHQSRNVTRRFQAEFHWVELKQVCFDPLQTGQSPSEWNVLLYRRSCLTGSSVTCRHAAMKGVFWNVLQNCCYIRVTWWSYCSCLLLETEKEYCYSENVSPHLTVSSSSK